MLAAVAWGKRREDFVPRRRSSGLLQVPGGGAPLPAALTAIPETSQERELVRRVWRSPCTRERRVEWWVGGPRACESCPTADAARAPRGFAPDLVFFMQLGGWLWCNNIAAVGPARRRPSHVMLLTLPLLSWWRITPAVRCLHECGLRVDAAGVFCLLCRRL
jgi:hypothetical protein